MTATDPAETPTLKTIGEGFYVRQAVDNIAWIDLGEHAVVVDALEQPELEAEVFSLIRRTLGDKPVRYVLNTHTHYDHVALNEAFRRQWGAEIVSHATGPLPPEGRWFKGPRRRVLMQPLPGCHTDEDCIVWVEPDKVLFTGDIFGWGLIPLTRGLRPQTADLLRRSYGRLIDLGAAVVVPGHGPLCMTAEMTRWVKYFDWLIEQVRAACAAGRSEDEIRRAVRVPADMKGWWRFEQWKHQDSLEKVIHAVLAGRLG